MTCGSLRTTLSIPDAEAPQSRLPSLLVFLGNPGPSYARSRHNLGWLLCDRLSFSASLAWRERYKGLFAQRGSLLLLKPQTSMNRSGESVRPCASFHRLAAGLILVVHDDLELPFGAFELKRGGGLGGHNGLRDIKRALSSADFQRLRLGVGRPARGAAAAFLLSRFSPQEEAVLCAFLDRAAAALESYLEGAGFDILPMIR